MTEPGADMIEQLADRLATYRNAFDHAFSMPIDDHREETIDIMMMGLADSVFALRVNELSGLQRCGKVVPIAGASPSLLGIVGIRGVVVPVFCLATLLGCASNNTKRWLMLCESGETLGLVFDEFLGVQLLQPTNLYPANNTNVHTHAPEVIRNGGRVVPVISIRSVIEELYRPSLNVSSSVDRRA